VYLRSCLRIPGQSRSKGGKIPFEATAAVAVANGLSVFPVANLAEVVEFLNGRKEIEPARVDRVQVWESGGGVLSHSAVVAREYGIPAVVGTGTATAVIKDGQVIEVDGTAGRVRMVSQNDNMLL
jgi:rifampicin phosphotransferase